MYDWEKLHQFLKEKTGRQDKVPDMVAANIIGVSEYQIRKARIDGMDEWMADRFAVNLGLHPGDIWGYDVWFDFASLFAGDLAEGLISSEEVEQRRAILEDWLDKPVEVI
jgi:hypothetical protein